MSSVTAPPRGFPQSEFEMRCQRAQKLMAEHQLDALLVMTEPEVRYFTGFKSLFWHSPTRPWYVVVPLEGKPVAVIPEIGVAGMRTTWISQIESWPAPVPADDGVSLLSGVLNGLPRRYGRIGVPMGHETEIRMPLTDLRRIEAAVAPAELVDATAIKQRLRIIKSELEIDKTRRACQIASGAFEALPAKLSTGMSEREACHALKLDMLTRGADDAPFVVGTSGPGGYDDIIMGPTDRVMGEGDVLIIDTGAIYDGYFCDFDRNFAFGHVDDDAKRAYETVFAATDAGIAAARPGATHHDLWATMWSVLEEGGALGESVGRLGHGLGIQLTEGPSNREGDMTVLEPGMVITIEPGMCFAPGKLMVHEENIVIRDGEAEMLSRRAAPEMPLISS